VDSILGRGLINNFTYAKVSWERGNWAYRLVRLAFTRIGCGFFIINKYAINVPKIPSPTGSIQSAVNAILSPQKLK
jgi:hypothetical protein